MRTQSYLLITLALLLPVLCGCDRPSTQKAHKHIGVINMSQQHEPAIDGFKEGMLKLGYVEGTDVIYEYVGVLKDMPAVERETKRLLDKKVDLIFTSTGPATLTVKGLTMQSKTPVVFAPVYDAVGSGIVNKLGEHNCHVTGIQIVDNAGKALQWLLEVKPDIKRVLAPHDSHTKASGLSLENLRQGAEKLGVLIVSPQANTREELDAALGDPSVKADAIFLLNSFFLVSNVDVFADAARKHRIPLASSTSRLKDGITLTYGQDLRKTGRMAARMAHRIFLGDHPSNLPVETAEFYLGINLKSARELGIEIPVHVVSQADFIEQ